MIITLYGKDSYIRKNKKQELIDSYKSKHEDADVVFFDLDEDKEAWIEVKDFLKQPSMFVDSKLAVVKNGTKVSKKEWREVLKSYLEDKSVFIIFSQERKPSKKFRFLLKSPAKIQEFKELEGKRLLRFFNKECKKRGVIFSEPAKRYFLFYIKNNKYRSWRVINQLDKIALAGFGSPISKEELEEIVEWDNKEEIYKITGKIMSSRSIPKSLIYLESLFLNKESMSHAFNSLGYKAKGSNAERLSKYDVSIKSGGLEYEEALLSFILDKV
ncbi:MAG TPA: hypothetical protein VKO61_01365 [Candidatus Paceibacterota bacterium]|nr:hypothetical protein [Candidatus Paceibacterota bacterium]